MGFENTDASDHKQSAPAPAFFSLLSVQKEQTGTKAQFTNLPGTREKEENQRTLDLSAPIYPKEKSTLNNTGEKGSSTSSDNGSAVPNEKSKPPSRYQTAIQEQVSQLASEAAFTPFTNAALNRDADRFPPVRNEKDGTTTYTIEQIGITDRTLGAGDENANHFKRLANITVPDNATSLKDCTFAFGDRQTIDVKEFDALVDHSQKRQSELSARATPEAKLTAAKDMSFYTHGIRTGAEDADFMALALQLTNGHSVINVDWKSMAAREEKCSVQAAYDINRRGAAESYPKFEKVLDQAIDHIGAEHTDMIAFSHGAMFDTRYLQHRKETHAPMLDEVVLAHPDVKCSAMKPADANGQVADKDQLYSKVSRRAYVIGSTSDLAMSGAAWNDCESAPKNASWSETYTHHQKQMEINARLGNGAPASRRIVTGHGGTYISETTPEDKKDPCNHFVNMSRINALINQRNLDMKLSSVERR
ncbi:MAG TPA: hypothetical protein V6C89_02870 [Drouetiella sp.]|jgi:hypothetical protein